MNSSLYKIILICLSIVQICDCVNREMSAMKSGITDQISTEYMLYRTKARSATECLQSCTHSKWCTSFFFHKAKSLCQLHYLHLSVYSRLYSEPGWTYYTVYHLSCPSNEGYIYTASMNFCIKPHRQHVSHVAADTFCRNERAVLVKIDTVDKRNIVKRVLGSSIYSGGFHIQGQKIHGVWRFYNGARMYHIEWSSGQPETGDYEINLMLYKPHAFGAHDIPPSVATYGFVCEKAVKAQRQLNSIL